MDREQVEYKEVSFFVNNAWLQFQKINLMKAVQINQTSSVVSLKLRKNKQIRKSTVLKNSITLIIPALKKMCIHV